MSCNKLIKPEFTKEQIEQCKTCNIASDNVRKMGRGFCGHFGCAIVPEGEIIQPAKKLILPPSARQNPQRPARPCNEKSIEADYEKYLGRYKGLPAHGGIPAGYEPVSKEIYVKRRQKCLTCPDEAKCPIRSCMQAEIAIRQSWECPKDKQ